MRENINDAEVENVLSAIRKLIVEGRPEPQREPPPSPFLLTPALRVGGEAAPAPLEPLILSAPIVAPAAAPRPMPRALDAERESAVPLQVSAKPEAALSLDPPVAAAPAPVIQASWSNLVTLAQADARREAVRKAEAAATVNDTAPPSPTDTIEPTPPVTRLDDAALPITASERPASQAHDTLVLHPAPEALSTTQPTPDASTADATDGRATSSMDTTTIGATNDVATSASDAPVTGIPDDLATSAPEAAATDTTGDYADPDADVPAAAADDDLAISAPTSATTRANTDAAPSTLYAPTPNATVAPDTPTAVTADEPTPDVANFAPTEDPDPTPADLAAASLPRPASDDLALPEPDPRAQQPDPLTSDLPLPDQATLRDLIREILHEELSREIIAGAVRAELQGELGETITRNLRRIVKQELLQALASRESA